MDFRTFKRSNECKLHKGLGGKAIRSLDAFLLTYHLTFSCCHFWCVTCTL